MIDWCPTHGAITTTNGVCPLCPPRYPEDRQELHILGLDLAKFHDYSALCVLRVKDRIATVKGLKVWPHVDYHRVVDDTAAIFQKYDAKMLAVDATGLGEPISEMFHARRVPTDDIKFGEYVEWTNPWGERERAPIKYAMMEYARACLQSDPPKVKFPKQGSDELIRQLKEQEMMVGPTERVTYAHPQGRHDDLAWAFLMALYTSRRWITGSGGWVKAVSQLTRKD